MSRTLRLSFAFILVSFIVLAGCKGGSKKTIAPSVPSPMVKPTFKKHMERKLARDKGMDLEGLGREDPFLPVSGEPKTGPRPATLTFAGVIGDTALLTKGNLEWIVKVGDIVEDKRVKEIREDSVVLVDPAGEETVVR